MTAAAARSRIDVLFRPAPRETHIVHKPYAWRIGVAVAVLLGTGAIAARGLPRWERSTFTAVYALPNFLEPVLWLPMQLGSAWAPVVVAAGAWIAWRRWRPALGALAIGLAAWSIAKVAKDIVGRGRPANLINDLALRSGAPTGGLGFVSGHSTVAFCLATVLSPYLGHRSRIAAYGLACLE